MNSFVIKCGGAEFSAGELAAVSCKLERRNLACDELVLNVESGSPAAAWAHGAVAELWQDGGRRFRGRVARVRKSRTYGDDRVEISIRNAFEDLSQIIFQKTAKAYCNGVLADRFTSRVVLGRDSANAKMTVAQQAREIVLFAAQRGADIDAGEMDVDNEMLFDECRDVSCAEALCRILKWSPMCCAYFDYSGSGAPKLNISKRVSLAEKDVDTSASKVKSFSAARRDDLRVNCVVINYEREDYVGNNAFLQIQEDVYPAQKPADARGTIVMGVELSGSKIAIQRSEIKTQTIQMSSKQWWKNHVELLADLDDFDIVETSRGGKLSKELVEGTITDDMPYNGEYDTVKGVFEYSTEDGSKVSKTISIKMATTNASTGIYTKHVMTETAETAPVGLAKAVYDASNALLYDGHITVYGAKSEEFFAKSLTVISDGKEKVIGAPVCWAEEDFVADTLKLKFGTSKHLYPDDIAELFRINRSRKVSTISIDSKTGAISASTVVLGGKAADNSVEESTTNYARFVVRDPALQSSIDMNPSQLPELTSMQIRSFYVCKNGFLARAYFIASAPSYVEDDDTSGSSDNEGSGNSDGGDSNGSGGNSDGYSGSGSETSGGAGE